MTIFTSKRQPIPIPDIDIYSFLFRPNEFNTTRSQDRPLLIDGISGKSLTFKQVRTISGQLATGWKENVGLKKGDVVAVFAPNQYDHAVLYFSLLAAQCILTPGNPNYTEVEFNHQVHKAQAKAIVTVPELLPVLLKVAAKNNIPKDKIFLFGDRAIDGVQPFSAIASKQVVQIPLQGVDSQDLAFICFSSGTTGVAKGVMLTHKNFVSQMIMVTDFEQTDANQKDDMIIGFLPFFHIFGLTTLVLRAFYSNTPVVVVPKYDLELVCQLIEKYKVTQGPIVPPVAVQLAKNNVVLKYDLSSLRIISSGAAPLGSEHIDALHLRVKAPVRQGYGLTETTAGCVYQRLGVSPSGSTGVLVANMECKLVDEEGNELGPDQPGEILMRGPVIMKGYLNDDKANAETFTHDGWMRTGDVAKFDSQTGEFFIIDRIKELIKYKGYQVAPAELEALLMSHDAVADCCIIGVYDSAQATELPRAYVVLQPSIPKTPASAAMISKFVEDNVISYKKLRGGVRFLDVIPKSPSGKILRRVLRDAVLEEEKQQQQRGRL
ncbi:4-coumarate- ligase protein [Mucor ambiguus]|uniref:4-coumarate-ligase protein n=1 Tax=Mucor ambiguus TaxID=91626 RepID=A0A0C9MHG0_9FUNG|nr:4-coumarate- ligase protein [Mucor ambiguus]